MQRPGPAVHRTIVVVDVEGFGDRRRTNAHQVAIRAGLYQVLRLAFEHAGVSWAACDHEDRGDGVVVLAPAEQPKAPFVDTVPHALVTALREHNTTHAAEARIRLRMALHAGEVTYDQHGVTATAVNLAFRLLDAAPLKTALAESPGVLAVITSGWFFDEVIRHSPACDPATWRPVQVSVKETSTVAWIGRPDYMYPPVPAHLADSPTEHRADPTPHRFSTSGSIPWPTTGQLSNELPVPRQLPLAIRDFTGRAEHLAALDALVSDEDDSTGSGAVVITAIDGTAGVGKTALAVHWAHRVQHRFPDGTLYANLRGYGPDDPATPGDVLGGFLAALGMPSEWIPVEVEARAGLYRSILAGRRVLILLDNANDAAQVRPLLPGAAGCAVVVTTRANPAGLVIGEGASRITVDLLTEQEALELVRAMLGSRRADAEPGAVSELIRACARLPLALRIAAGRAVAHPHLTIADLVAELDSEHGRWEALSAPADEHTAVRVVFDWSYDRLTNEQARMLRRLGLHPGPDISLHIAAAVADLEVAQARRLLVTLAESHLIEPTARDRYHFHDLLRAYAADRADHDDTPADRDQARRTLLEWYAHHGKNAYLAIAPRHSDWLAGAGLDTHARPEIAFPGPAEAWAWADLELVNAVAAVRAAIRHGLPQFAVVLASTSAGALSLLGLWDDVFDISHLGLTAARRIGDRTAECQLLNSVGHTHHCVAQWQEAIDSVHAAMVLARELGNPGLQVAALSNLGWICIEQERYADAQEHLRAALPLSTGVQHGRLESFVEYSLSAVSNGLGDHDQALRHAERSLALIRNGHLDVEASAPHAIAQARRSAGAHPDAIALCEQASSVIERYREPRGRASFLDTRCTSLQHTDVIYRAATCWRVALETFDGFAAPRTAELRARLDALEKANTQQSKNSSDAARP